MSSLEFPTPIRINENYEGIRMRTAKVRNGERRYGAWAGNPDGYPEDKECCVAEIANPPSWQHKQCLRKRGHGPGGEYCKQHAAKIIRD